MTPEIVEVEAMTRVLGEKWQSPDDLQVAYHRDMDCGVLAALVVGAWAAFAAAIAGPSGDRRRVRLAVASLAFTAAATAWTAGMTVSSYRTALAGVQIAGAAERKTIALTLARPPARP